MDYKVRNEKIDMLRGIAAVCMILGHSFIYYPVDISQVGWCAFLSKIIYSFHMELFFVLAGWVYKCEDYKKFIQKRIERLLIPYLFFGICSLVLHVVGGGAVNGTVSIKDGLIKFLFYGGDYWFIYTLFLISLIYPLFSRFTKRIGTKIIILICLLIVGGAFNITDIIMLNAVVKYMPYFILGDILGKWKLLKNNNVSNKQWLVASLISLMIYVISCIYVRSNWLIVENIFLFIKAISFCVMLYGLCSIRINDNQIISKFNVLLKPASRYSLQLYLFNGYILTAVRIIICSWLNIRNSLIIVATIWTANVIITFFICKVILPKSAILSRICGVQYQK